MKPSKKFVSLVELDPNAAMYLHPDVQFQVSKRTFAEVAAATLNTQKKLTRLSSEPAINIEQDKSEFQ